MNFEVFFSFDENDFLNEFSFNENFISFKSKHKVLPKLIIKNIGCHTKEIYRSNTKTKNKV